MNWLFRFFLLIGFLVVIALFSALFAPYFINWERFTSGFEQQASRIVGQPVKVGGQSNLRLLPLPFISFEDLEVGHNDDGSPLMTVERFSLRAELLPFLSGEVRIVEMSMLQPQLNLKVKENGTVAWTSPKELLVNPEQINIEKLSIENGSMTVDGLAGGRRLSVENIQGDLSARSVLGPWRIDINADVEGVASQLKISTGTFQTSERSIRLKIEGNRSDQPYKLLVDGPVKLQNDVLNWSGDFSLTPFSAARTAQMTRPVDALPVHTEGVFLASPQLVQIPEYRMEIGSREDPYTITGSGNVSIQKELFFRFRADGRQIDLDHLEQVEQAEGSPTFETRLAVVRSILERIPVPTGRGEINALLPAIVAGDTFIREVKTAVRPLGRGWELRSFSAVFPGNTLVEANGRLGLRDNFGFAGKVLVASRQPSGLAAWMSGGVDAQIRRLKTLGLTSDVTITTRQATFDNLELRMDDAVLDGKLQRLAPLNGRAAIITDLNGNRVNTQDLMALYSLTRDPSDVELASHDLDIKIKADLLEAQLLEKPVIAGEVDAHIRIKDGNVSIERLNAGDFYGSSLVSSGRLERVLESPDGNFRLDVKAQDLRNLLAFTKGFTGNHFLLDALQAESALTKDTSLNFELDTRSRNGGAKGQLLVSGILGGTGINTRLAFEGDIARPEKIEIDANSTFSNPSASRLARQFAMETLPDELTGEVPGPVRFNLGLKGKPEEGFATNLALSSPSTNLSAKGRAKAVTSEEIDYSFDVTLGSGNLAPYLLLVGTPLPGIGVDTTLPVSLIFKLDRKDPAAKFSRIEGQVAGNSVSGDLEYQYAQVQRPRLSGKLELSKLPVPLIAKSVFGFSDLLGTDLQGLGVEQEFQPAGLAGYDARIAVKAKQIDTGFGFSAANGSAQLVMLDGAVDLNNLTFEALGGRFNGGLGLKNAEGTVLATLRYSLSNADLPKVLDVAGIPRVATGTVSINGSAEAGGRSQSAMLSSISGDGVIALKSATVTGIDPLSFPNILLESDVEGFEINSERVEALVDETVLVSELEVPFIDAPFSITRGRAKIRNLVHATPEADFNSGIEIDISDAALEGETSLAFKPGRRDAISGADPVVRVAWQGPFNAMTREIDGSQLESYLSLRAFENSQRRIETLEAQVIEKQRIQREIAFNFAREQHQVRKEEEARRLLEEQLQRESESERRRFEEAARQLEEELARQREEVRKREEAERKRIEEEQRRQAEEQARLQEEQRLLEELQREEEAARLEAERQAAAQRAAEQAASEAAQRPQDQSTGTIEGVPLPPPNDTAGQEVAPSLRESIINNIENFLNTN